VPAEHDRGPNLPPDSVWLLKNPTSLVFGWNY